MPRGYRRIIIAAVGWLILAAAVPPNNGAHSNQRNTSADVSQSLDAIAAAQNKIADNADPGEYQRPCDPGKDNRKSDLCAQWEAAVAARDAAKWAFWSLAFGIVGAVGIVAALALTFWSNLISRDTARRQLRAYISVEPRDMETELLKRGQHNVALAIEIKNGGETPAYNVSYGGNIVVFTPTRARAYFEADYKLASVKGEGSNATQHSDTIHHGFVASTENIKEADLKKIRAGKASLFAYGFVEYADTFKVRHITRFCFELNPDNFLKADRSRDDETGLTPVEWTYPPFHNDAD